MIRRMDETHLQAVDDALGHLDLARQALATIDLRHYGGDAEVRSNLKGVQQQMRGCRKLLRHVKTLRWRR